MNLTKDQHACFYSVQWEQAMFFVPGAKNRTSTYPTYFLAPGTNFVLYLDGSMDKRRNSSAIIMDLQLLCSHHLRRALCVIQIKYGLPYCVNCPSMSTDLGIHVNTGAGDTVLAKHTPSRTIATSFVYFKGAFTSTAMIRKYCFGSVGSDWYHLKNK